MPAGPWHYPEDELSDLPNRMLVAEIVRMGEMSVAQLEAALDVVERRDDNAAEGRAAIRELWEETGQILGRPGTWDTPPDAWRGRRTVRATASQPP